MLNKKSFLESVGYKSYLILYLLYVTIFLRNKSDKWHIALGGYSVGYFFARDNLATLSSASGGIAVSDRRRGVIVDRVLEI
jgi:hypothetical protein